jgi:hypothetical protein
MQFTIPLDPFTRALVQLQASTGPWKGTVCLAAGPDGVQVARTEEGMTIGVHLPEAQVQEEGQILVAARSLQEVLLQGTAGGTQVTLRGTPAALRITLPSLGRELTLPGEDPAALPARIRLPRGAWSWQGTLDLVPLRRAWRGLVAMRPLVTHPVFLSVLWQVHTPTRGQLTLVRIDPFRLAIHTLRTGVCSDQEPHQGSLQEQGLLLQAAALREGLRVLPRRGTVVMTVWRSGEVGFQAGPVTLLTTVCPEVFPDYRQGLPREYGTRAVLPVRELRTQLQAVRASTRQRETGIRLQFCRAQGQVQIWASSAAEGEGDPRMLEAIVEGNDLEVQLNVDYLLEALKEAPSVTTVEITGTTPQRPLVLRVEDARLTLTTAIMPIWKRTS